MVTASAEDGSCSRGHWSVCAADMQTSWRFRIAAGAKGEDRFSLSERRANLTRGSQSRRRVHRHYPLGGARLFASDRKSGQAAEHGVQ